MFCLFFLIIGAPPRSTLSLHDALPIWKSLLYRLTYDPEMAARFDSLLISGHKLIEQIRVQGVDAKDRKSTRLNSSHANISYAVFCLKKKKHQRNGIPRQGHPDTVARAC